MESGLILIYILKASIYLLLFFAFNKWLLGRETLHKLNRFLWLAISIFSFALPLLDGVVLFEEESVEYVTTTNIVAMPIGVSVEADSTTQLVPTIVNALFIIYLLGVGALLIYNIVVHCSLFNLIFFRRYNIRNSTWDDAPSLCAFFEECEERMGLKSRRIEYVVHQESIPPFSWMNYVVVSRADLEESRYEIVIHELSHIKQHHSWDILFINAVTIVMWFNPAAWLTKRSLQQVHEYCADESVVAQGVNIKEYQLLLIKKAVGARLYSISNSLNHSNLKNRITMMLQKKSNKMVAAKCLYTIPLALGVLSVFASPTFVETLDEVTEVKITKKIETSEQVTKEITPYHSIKSEEEPFLICEKMPTFQGGDLSDFRMWLMTQLRYPEEAAKKGIKGIVVAKFIVEKDGSVDEIEIIRSPDQTLSDEVIRLLESSPKWVAGEQEGKPVRVNFTLPVQFNIANDEPKSTDGELLATNDPKPKSTMDESNVVYIVNGKVSLNKLGDLSAEHIQSIDVVKDKSRNAEFGVDSDADLVIVTLRDGVDPGMVTAAVKYQKKYDFATVMSDGMIIQKLRGEDVVTYMCPDGRDGEFPKENIRYMKENDTTVYKTMPKLDSGSYKMNIHVETDEGEEFPTINVLISEE